MTRLRRQARSIDAGGQRFSKEKQPEVLTPECHHLNAPFNESTAFEFRPLTEEEKNQFLNALDANGKRILAELEGRRSKVLAVT